jgi:hypothetical protein
VNRKSHSDETKGHFLLYIYMIRVNENQSRVELFNNLLETIILDGSIKASSPSPTLIDLKTIEKALSNFRAFEL